MRWQSCVWVHLGRKHDASIADSYFQCTQGLNTWSSQLSQRDWTLQVSLLGILLIHLTVSPHFHKGGEGGGGDDVQLRQGSFHFIVSLSRCCETPKLCRSQWRSRKSCSTHCSWVDRGASGSQWEDGNFCASLYCVLALPVNKNVGAGHYIFYRFILLMSICLSVCAHMQVVEEARRWCQIP